MVTANVRFYGVLGSAIPVRRAVVELPPAFALPDLVLALSQQFGEPVRAALLNRSGFAKTYVRFYVNGAEAVGAPEERFGPFPDGGLTVEIHVVPMSEGG